MSALTGLVICFETGYPYLTVVLSDSVSIKTGEPPIPKYLSKKAFSNYVVFDLPNRAYGAISLIDLTLSYL